MKTTKKIVWAAPGTNITLPSTIHTEYEVERELPGGGAFRIYGSVDLRGTGYDHETGGPEGLEAIIYVTGVSYWPESAPEASELTSLDEAAALTGWSAEKLGDLVYEAYEADIEDRACA